MAALRPARADDDQADPSGPGGILMSELAFDDDGEPFAFSPRCARLRVRRFRKPGERGAPEVVHDEHGGQRYVAPDISYLEFRKLVGNLAGRYRLDQCDEHGIPLPKDEARPAYVTISETLRAVASGDGDSRDALIRDLASINAEIAKTIAERFAAVMQASADLLRAADGAGLPRREPPPPAPAAEEDEDEQEEEDDDQDDDEGASDASAWLREIRSFIDPMLPMVKAWIAAQVAKRSASSSPPPPAATPTPTPATPPAPAPAAAPSAAAGSGGVAAGASPSSSAAAAEPRPAPVAQAATAAAAEPAPTASAVATEPTVARNAAPSPTVEQIAHLLAIRAQLTEREGAIVDGVIEKMGPEVQAQWLAELSALTVEQAVDLVRSMIPHPTPRPGQNEGGS